MNNRKKHIIVAILAFIGVAISAYLIPPYVNNESIELCLGLAQGESGCDVVRNSQYADFLKIKIPIFGALFYGFILIWKLLSIKSIETISFVNRKLGFNLDELAVYFGLIFSLYLTYLEAFVIDAWCLFCVIQAIISLAIFILYVKYEMFKKGVLIWAVILFVIFQWINSALQPGAHDEFAQCIADSGAKMYGAYWCPSCKKQKAFFGKSFSKINYIECALPNNGINPQCKKADIQGYPTWIINGEKKTGAISLDKLSELTQCKL